MKKNKKKGKQTSGRRGRERGRWTTQHILDTTTLSANGFELCRWKSCLIITKQQKMVPFCTGVLPLFFVIIISFSSATPATVARKQTKFLVSCWGFFVRRLLLREHAFVRWISHIFPHLFFHTFFFQLFSLFFRASTSPFSSYSSSVSSTSTIKKKGKIRLSQQRVQQAHELN